MLGPANGKEENGVEISGVCRSFSLALPGKQEWEMF